MGDELEKAFGPAPNELVMMTRPPSLVAHSPKAPRRFKGRTTPALFNKAALVKAGFGVGLSSGSLSAKSSEKTPISSVPEESDEDATSKSLDASTPKVPKSSTPVSQSRIPRFSSSDEEAETPQAPKMSTNSD